tara:strand:- start:6372 stop:7121 length:750 start_codon:yes stop_codon:yes gene_type:complete
LDKESDKSFESIVLDSFKQNSSLMPSHIAIIMDGNRRWAAKKKIPVFSGHKAGTKNIESILKFMELLGIKFLTLFTFSTENWGRPKKEVNYITKTLLSESLSENFSNLHKLGVKILIKGSIKRLDDKTRDNILKAVKKTENNKTINLIIAFDYGGRKEIIETTKKIVNSKVNSEEIDENLFNQFLNNGVPDPDLVIRTGGEYRLSNFLIWQTAYSEFFTSDELWPDFGVSEFSKALIEFSKRKRRFGAD